MRRILSCLFGVLVAPFACAGLLVTEVNGKVEALAR
jgi:hypothetical protein